MMLILIYHYFDSWILSFPMHISLLFMFSMACPVLHSFDIIDGQIDIFASTIFLYTTFI